MPARLWRWGVARTADKKKHAVTYAGAVVKTFRTRKAALDHVKAEDIKAEELDRSKRVWAEEFV